ncbi:MAG: thioesterase family protein [Solirubrobacteraceae bacterium]
MAEAVFVAAGEGECFEATELARGPWDPGAQHGGAPAALLMRAFERLVPDDELSLARVTYEFVRPVPLGLLTVQAEVVRPGRRVRLSEGSIVTAQGIEVVRARALHVRVAEPEAAADRESTSDEHEGSSESCAGWPSGPETGTQSDLSPTHRPMFAPDAIEIRFLTGAFYEPGPATAWLRLRCPLVAGEEASPRQRLAAAADFGNGISSSLSWDEYTFINPDLTLYVERPPRGEWIGLRAQTRIARGGVAVSESVLYDEHGRVGRATQALLVLAR